LEDVRTSVCGKLIILIEVSVILSTFESVETYVQQEEECSEVPVEIY
jgi:hypothetical protein